MQRSPTNIVKGNLFIVAAASGTGKTSLVKRLISSTENLVVSISHTTRKPRPGEVDGEDYYFIEEDAFIEDIKAGYFLESAQVFGNYYGTAEKIVEDQLNAGLDVILEIDWQGALQVKKQRPDAVSIFILPPNVDTLRQRLYGRGQDSKQVIEHRLAGAMTEMQQFINFDYLIINQDFDIAWTEMRAVILAHRLSIEKQEVRYANFIGDLLQDKPLL